jgi:hypothetical protein
VVGIVINDPKQSHLFLYSKMSGDKRSKECAGKADEFFLSRNFYLRKTNGQVIKSGFTKLIIH